MCAACGAGSEAVEIQLPVATDSARMIALQTDQGYAVTITSARAAIANIALTAQGEEHEASAPAILFHPGHAGGGTVIGELRGNYIVSFNDDASIGTARLLTGRYAGFNFAFRRAGDGDDLDTSDPLYGHTFHLVATVTRDAQSWSADITLDLAEDAVLVGAPLDFIASEMSDETIGLQLSPTDPFESDTVFDGVDFAALADANGDIVIAPGQTAHNQIRRLLGSHDHYFARATR